MSRLVIQTLEWLRHCPETMKPRAKVDGMTDHIVVHATHPFLPKDRRAIEQTVHFLREGRFKRSESRISA